MEKQLIELRQELAAAWQKLDLDNKIAETQELEREVAKPEIWLNPENAKNQNTKLARLNTQIEPWQLLRTQIEDVDELLTLGDDDLADELNEQITQLAKNLNNLKLSLRFTGKYDSNGAILRITAGVGGTEAMDWAGMLERMYLRFAERQGWKVTCLDRTTGEEAGIKTAVYEITPGNNPKIDDPTLLAISQNIYGSLKSEHGVHRLVRLSPFNADNLRQTSFALVEILPIIENDDDIKIDDKDLRIDVYHAGGHGGQSVNTTNSAVRITHLPTNTVVAIQNERSQLQNKEKAMEVLRGKLIQMQQEQHAASLDQLRAGESAKWGQQIRNYVLQPYKLVKDTRTKYETTDTDAVLDGKIEDFINAFLGM